MIVVRISGVLTTAVLDTASPYPICAPGIAEQIDSTSLERLEELRMITRLGTIRGALYRMPISFPASQGDDLEVDATVFIPTSAADWYDQPSYIGLTGCLERMRFALDSGSQPAGFYFGPA